MISGEAAYVALALVPGIGRARLQALLASFGTAEAVLAASQDELRSVRSISLAAATAIRATTPEDGQRVHGRTEDLGGVVLHPDDERFPAQLREIPHAPTLLFARGRVDVLQSEGVAIVGSRDHSRYGSDVCRHFAAGVANAGLAVVSGMARGLDAIAHEACLDAGGTTVGVLGNGLGIVYPAANRALYRRVERDGCLLTEFPPGERPNAGSFPRRNRLISGLARVTLVVEANARSGALITADCALAQGKEVLAVPGQVTNALAAGCNRLIQQGAKAALELRDVLEEYGLASNGAAGVRLPHDLSADERRVLEILGLGVDQVDEIGQRFGQPPAHALAVLTSLEIRGLVIQEPGKIFRPALDVAVNR